MASKNISCLPSDLLVVVLCRLEIKFLVRCTSVCKTWHHSVHSSFCAKAHNITYQKTSSNAKKYILHQGFESCTLLTAIKPLIEGTYKHSGLCYSPESFDECQLRIHGICDGLLCISNDGISCRGYCVGDNIYLWNPIFRKAKKLPELKITKEDDGLIRRGGLSFGYYGNDYKVIVISCVDRKYVVSVYSLSSNCWNVIHTNSYYEHKIEGRFDVFCIMQPTKFVDGFSYMILDVFRRRRLSYKTPNAIPPLTICFDLRDQAIQQFKCPDEYIQNRTQYTMDAYGEKIVVLACDSYSGYLTMWTLFSDKFSSKSLWEKKLVIKLKERDDYAFPVGFLYNDKYMVLTTFTLEYGEQTTLFLYDLESQEVKEYNSPEDYADHYCKIDSNYVESFLLLNEDKVDPFVQQEMESSCNSMLFTLHNALYNTSRKRKR